MTVEHTEPPVEFTKARVAEIGNAWMAYAKTQFELAKEKTPPQLKTLLKMDRKPGQPGTVQSGSKSTV